MDDVFVTVNLKGRPDTDTFFWSQVQKFGFKDNQILVFDVACQLVDAGAEWYAKYTADSKRAKMWEDKYKKSTDLAEGMFAALGFTEIDWPGLYPSMKWGDEPIHELPYRQD